MENRENKILVLCVDRDNDLGVKADINGPVIGEKNVMEAAVSLGISDPSDSDVNAMFETIKVYRELKHNKKSVEIAIITGDIQVGTVSDTKIAAQIDNVIKKTGATSVVIISDGLDDEYIIPIIESRIKIDSVDRLIVKQSEHLEGFYYLALGFLKRVLRDPYLSKMLIGLPGLIILLLGIYGFAGWRVIAFLGGLVLIIKGFHFESMLESGISEFVSSYKEGKISFFTNLLSLLLIFIGFAQGVTAIKNVDDPIEITVSFINGGLWWFSFSISLIFTGKILESIPNIPKITIYILKILYILTLSYMLDFSTKKIINPEIPVQDVVSSIAIGIAMILALSILEGKLKRRFPL